MKASIESMSARQQQQPQQQKLQDQQQQQATTTATSSAENQTLQDSSESQQGPVITRKRTAEGKEQNADFLQKQKMKGNHSRAECSQISQNPFREGGSRSIPISTPIKNTTCPCCKDPFYGLMVQKFLRKINLNFDS